MHGVTLAHESQVNRAMALTRDECALGAIDPGPSWLHARFMYWATATTSLSAMLRTDCAALTLPPDRNHAHRLKPELQRTFELPAADV
jgi:hypothetical protein